MTFAQLYCLSGNIGDDFQGLAASALLPSAPTTFIDRDDIHRWQGDGPAVLIMNGWFSLNAEAWPPPASIHPVFVGFHVANRFKPIVERHADYLRRFQPIGVRDEATRRFLASIGIEAETTYCPTLTFPTRDSAPRDGRVFIVDAEAIYIPPSLRKGAIKMTHMMPPLDAGVTLPCARQLLKRYRDEASLVITTRLHAALPCIAMGIPVVYFGEPHDGRTSIVRDIGGTIHDLRLHKKAHLRGMLGRTFGRVDWSPKPLDVARTKAALKSAVSTRLESLAMCYA